MGLKRAESQLQILLADTIWAMCKNTLAFNGGIRVEGLIGVTIDEEEIFLIPVNQKICKEVPNEVAIVEAEQSTLPAEFRMKRTNDSQNDSDSSDSSSDSSDSDNGNVNESGYDNEKKKKSKRKRKRRRKSTGGEVPPETPSRDNGFGVHQPLPGVSTFTTDMNRPGPMIIKPEAGNDEQGSDEEAAQDLVIVKSEFGAKGPQKPLTQGGNNWPGSSGPSQQQIPPSAHQNTYQGNSFTSEGHAAAILQHLSSIQTMATMQYPGQSPMSMCAQSPQNFGNQSRPHSFDSHSQPSSSQSPVAQTLGDHGEIYGDGYHLTRKRTSFSPRQIAALEQAFNQHGHYMNAHERSMFARSIGLTEKVVTIWFQNRRQKLKKSEQRGQNPGQIHTP